MPGKIEMIVGGMYSGKSTEIIKRMNRFQYSKKGYVLFKPKMDDRYSKDDVVTHDKSSLTAISIDSTKEILKYCEEHPDIKNLGIDEIQFLNDKNPEDALIDLTFLRKLGYHIIASGLDMDAMGQPFGFVPQLLAIADEVHKQKAVCFDCGADAGMTHRTSESKEIVQLGSKDRYKAVCVDCWVKLNDK
jgi:thymidine kinase